MYALPSHMHVKRENECPLKGYLPRVLSWQGRTNHKHMLSYARVCHFKFRFTPYSKICTCQVGFVLSGELPMFGQLMHLLFISIFM